MDRRRKRIVAIGAATALAVTGGGVAYATTRDDQQQALLRDAAARLNVSPDELRSALEGAFGDQLDDAVKAGRLTQKQADRIKQEVKDHGLPLGGPMGGPHGRMGGPGGHDGGPFGVGLDAAADYLGLTRAQLARRLRNGTSLAQVAKAEGKSVDGLKQALVDAAKQQLDEAVADGKLTDDQRGELLDRLKEHVDELVAGTGPGPRGRHGEPGGPGGPPPWGGDHDDQD